ncbi:hypothetical protein HDU96_003363, partial [Phlyctochytrium bullatum]
LAIKSRSPVILNGLPVKQFLNVRRQALAGQGKRNNAPIKMVSHVLVTTDMLGGNVSTEPEAAELLNRERWDREAKSLTIMPAFLYNF